MRSLTLLGLIAAFGLAGCAGGPRRVTRQQRFHLTHRDLQSSRFGTHPEYLKSLAGSYVLEERYDEAQDTYMDALLLKYGDDFEAQVAMGLLYERQGDINRAVAHYARARNIRPGHTAGWYHLRRVKPRMVIMRGTNEQADGFRPNDGGGGAGEDAEDDG